ncbi:hypothetical protein [Chryseolinea lacunae]|uniref:Tetrapyrrole biosynthesis glutamyl-tRNA reductase dimerisation domain-containing protein n=1 Tax=Chryseolinea lacunae TaxID=2801331 RepID=A0ABS1L2F9_9BACT|nr:hypothetical protein [Chryseolinea lacunae]MBL0745727.1 hypothetical protein [Chryseolinea lacunae]
MVDFRQRILSRIKSASNEEEVTDVIEQSIQRLKGRNVHGHIIQRFILGMSKVLSQARIEAISEREECNVDLAIDIFRQLHRP